MERERERSLDSYSSTKDVTYRFDSMPRRFDCLFPSPRLDFFPGLQAALNHRNFKSVSDPLSGFWDKCFGD
ncbi:hypothetical protein U9M48_017259 [Paspalum notatum var. saurae]|uniref:Uncharacterized protein n=1 Tax=Paspalum notatum var. saurae TaxID=547442 RepID=A0AAQ3WP49_PASNO